MKQQDEQSKKEISSLECKIVELNEQIDKNKELIDCVLWIRNDMLKHTEVIREVRDIPNTFKDVIIDLLDYTKQDLTIKTAKVIDNVLHIAYRNGWFGVIEMIKWMIRNNTTIDQEIIGELSRQPKQNLDKA